MKQAAMKQSGYTDLQVMPAIIGIILLIVCLGMLNKPEFDPDTGLLKLSLFLLPATAAVCFGFGMHLYCLGYPESPFNRHSSPVFMTFISSGVMFFAAWRFFNVNILIGTIIYMVLGISLVCITAGLAIYRARKTGNE